MFVTVGALSGCSLIGYLFFRHCPVSEELLAAKRKIRTGMTATEAWNLLPDTRWMASDDDSKYKDNPPAQLNGNLYASDSTSVQCHCSLEVRIEDGKVSKTKLELYNDLNHSVREIR